MAEVLGEAEVAAAIEGEGLGWQLEGGQLSKVVRRRDFAGALALVNAIGVVAEAADHHPDIDIRWNTVTLHLSTHSAGGITQKDLDLAAAIDRLGASEG